MEFRVLEYFLTVAREQNITAAAETLHISQPALSTQLKALEAELGKQLLIRGVKGSRKVVLTEEGMILRKRAEEMLALMHKTEAEIRGSEEVITGNVFIGTGETEIVRMFARVAQELQKTHPDIRYHITSGNAEHVLEYLDKGLIDFGLIYTAADSKKYETLPVPLWDTWGRPHAGGQPIGGENRHRSRGPVGQASHRLSPAGRRRASKPLAGQKGGRAPHRRHLQPGV